MFPSWESMLKMTETNCEICDARIDFAGSIYKSNSGEDVCLKCITIERGSRDDLSYISSAEKTRNSMGVVI